MEIASINPGFDFTIKPSHAAKTFFSPATNGAINNFISAAAPQFQLSDIEMVTFDPTPYTSLKDLLQTSPPPSSIIMSPNNNNNSSGPRKDSWREIPIKDPLLQHAAWAYLQPMSTDDTEAVRNRSVMNKLKERCCAVFGCFNDVLLVVLPNVSFLKGINDKRKQKQYTSQSCSQSFSATYSQR